MNLIRIAASLLLGSLLVACSPVTVRPDAAGLAAQTAREQALAGMQSWALEARLAVSDGSEGGSGSLSWHQQGATFDFVLRAPVTGRSFRLRGGPGHASLEGLAQGELHGADARQLLWQALGWQVPLQQLDYWVRGMRAPGGPAELLFAGDGLPARLEQDGWVVEYRDWYADFTPPLPRRVFASQANSRVRLVISGWTLD